MVNLFQDKTATSCYGQILSALLLNVISLFASTMLVQFHFVNSVSEKVYIMVLDVNGIKHELNIEPDVELLSVAHNMKF